MGLSLSVQYKKVSEHFTVLVVCGEYRIVIFNIQKAIKLQQVKLIFMERVQCKNTNYPNTGLSNLSYELLPMHCNGIFYMLYCHGTESTSQETREVY